MRDERARARVPPAHDNNRCDPVEYSGRQREERERERERNMRACIYVARTGGIAILRLRGVS